jgi:hypothetical protein
MNLKARLLGQYIIRYNHPYREELREKSVYSDNSNNPDCSDNSNNPDYSPYLSNIMVCIVVYMDKREPFISCCKSLCMQSTGTYGAC